MYIGIAGKAMVSNTALAWLGNGDVRPRTNSSMLRDPDVKSATGTWFYIYIYMQYTCTYLVYKSK